MNVCFIIIKVRIATCFEKSTFWNSINIFRSTEYTYPVRHFKTKSTFTIHLFLNVKKKIAKWSIVKPNESWRHMRTRKAQFSRWSTRACTKRFNIEFQPTIFVLFSVQKWKCFIIKIKARRFFRSYFVIVH